MTGHVIAWNSWDEPRPYYGGQWPPPEHDYNRVSVRIGLLVDFDERIMRVGLEPGASGYEWEMLPGPTVPFEDDGEGGGGPLHLGLVGFFGEAKEKEVLPDGAIRPKRITFSLRTGEDVPQAG